MLPVHFWGVVPFANKSQKETHDKTFVEARNEVDASDDVVGIKKPKCAILKAGYKLDLV